EQVLRADVVVVCLARFVHRELENLLRARRVGQIRAGRLAGSALSYYLVDLGGESLGLHAERFDHRSGDAPVVAEEAEQNVLRADVFVMEPRRLFARASKGPPNAFGKVVSVHWRSKKALSRSALFPQRSAQLLLICWQAEQISLHFRHVKRAD